MAEFQDALPRLNEHHQVQEIKIDQGVLSQTTGEPRLVGFDLSKVRADAKPARVLRLMDNNITVNFLEYSNWNTTLSDSMTYIQLLLSFINLTINPVSAISLRYIDRYTYDGPSEEPNAGMLLQRDNAYVAPYCFEGGSLWHCHTGWFEMLSTTDRILHQLNVGSAIVDQASTVTIDHNAILQLRAPRQSIDSFLEISVEKDSGIRSVLNRLHGENGNILRNMLVADMLQEIGLSE